MDITLAGHTYRNVWVVKRRYAGGGTALQIVDSEGLVATATVWLANKPSEGCVWIKDWSENRGMVAGLMAAGLIEPTGWHMDTGYETAVEARLLMKEN